MNEEKIITFEEAVATHKDLFPETEEREREQNETLPNNEIPEDIKEVFKTHLKNQFVYGMKVGLNTGVGIIYEKIGLGGTDFSHMDKEDLVSIMDAVVLWCEASLDKDYVTQLKARLSEQTDAPKEADSKEE